MRSSLLVLGLLATLGGVWTLVVESLAGPPFPHRSDDVGRLGWAARLGLGRGDLWASEALLAATAAADAPASAALALDAARRALALSPTRSDLWLLVSGLTASGSATRKDDALEMAYLVGGGKPEELAARLARAARSPGLGDDTLQAFIKTDIALALAKPAASGAVLAAFGGASPANKAIFLQLVRAADPAVADKLAATP